MLTLFFPIACTWIDQETYDARFDDDGDGIPRPEDCDDDDPEIGVATLWYSDRDDDGYGDANATRTACSQPQGYVTDTTDCDDGRDSVYPDAPEKCDGVDNDCDGATDDADEPVDPSVFYLDEDGDGWGVDSKTAQACLPPDGFAAQFGDCDDTNADVSPSQPELFYDGIDGDCDGESDFDQDGDGFDVREQGTDCNDTDASINPGVVEVWYDGIDSDCDDWSDFDQDFDGFDSVDHDGEDCDDTLAVVNPALEEVCGDTLDNDCNGDRAPCGWAGAYTLDEGDAFVGETGQAVGSLLRLVEFDGVGLAIGGEGTLMLMPPAAGVGPLSSVVTLTLEEQAVGEGIGSVLAPLPRVHGGEDLLVGAPADDGTLHVLLGPLTGTLTSGETDVTIDGLDSGDGLGSAVAAGDFSGDGIADVAVGAPGVDALDGAVYVLQGPLTTSGDVDTLTSQVITGIFSEAGAALVAGDHDGDGLDDLMIGGPGDDKETGIVGIALGPVTGSGSLIPVTDYDLKGERNGDRAGQTLSFDGDITGDGIDDLLVGAPERNGDRGSIYLVAGGAAPSGDFGAMPEILGGYTQGRAGTAMSVSDIDGDGFFDLIAGSPGVREVDSDAGYTMIVYGPITGGLDLRDAEAVFAGQAELGLAGQAVLGVPDLDADGYDEFFVGAPGLGDGGTVVRISGDIGW